MPCLTYRSEAGTVANNRYDDFQLCISHHDHHHQVEIFLTVTAGDADMYLSAHIPRPRAERHTWNAARAGSDHISLKTNLWDWDQKSEFLFIGVRGQGRTSVYRQALRLNQFFSPEAHPIFKK